MKERADFSLVLDHSFDVVKEMRLAPFTLFPVLPLTLTLFSLEQLLDRLLKVVL